MIDAYDKGEEYSDDKYLNCNFNSIKDLISLTNNDDSYGHFKYGDIPIEITKMHSEY